MIWSVAWRNIWRNKLRSLVVIVAVIIGLTGGIFSVALMNGMMEQMITSSIETQISNIQIHNPKYLDNNEIKYDIADYSKVVEDISQMQEVFAVCHRIKAPAMASTAVTGTGVMITGINPSEEKMVTTISEKLIEGDYFESKSRIPSVLIGKKLAQKLHAKTKSKIVITLQSMDGVITYGAFRVVGIFDTHNSVYDESTIFVENNSLSSLIGFNPENTTEIAIRLKNNQETGKVADILTTKLPDLKIQTWMQIRPEFEIFNMWMEQMLYLFLVIILLALAFGIVNAMLMAVMERVREIGMLMAVGMNKRRVFGMIMLETILLSITGGIIGILISYGLVEYFAVVGINLSVVGEGLSNFGYENIAYPSVTNAYYFIIGGMVVITAIIASVYPARKALKLKPADAIREDA